MRDSNIQDSNVRDSSSDDNNSKDSNSKVHTGATCNQQHDREPWICGWTCPVVHAFCY